MTTNNKRPASWPEFLRQWEQCLGCEGALIGLLQDLPGIPLIDEGQIADDVRKKAFEKAWNEMIQKTYCKLTHSLDDLKPLSNQGFFVLA